ncbi:MAG: response regulator transcription factor [Prevotellaceae bacterium]|jgi:DNA-binding NarL/FixJ family response regulator|nr:response regulator transcription factor [Prevotellaceae bacterium]
MYEIIAIVERSKIIRTGLASIFKTHSLCSRTVKMESFDDWDRAFRADKPDLLIVNPDCLRDADLDKIKSRFDLADELPVFALIYRLFEPETIAAFDEAIYITDSEDAVVGKLRNRYKKEQSPAEKLTDREKDILRHLLKGLSNKEAADRLNISPHTVMTHRKNIIEKTGIRSLSGLAVYAIINNITDMNEIN